MSIASEINRISGNIADALDEVSNKGVTVPSGSNSDDLASLIRQISGGDGYVWQDQNGYVHLSDEQGTQTIIDALTVSGAGTSTAPTGHAYNPVTVPSGSASTPATSVTANPTISVSSGGLITATASATKSVTPSVSAGWVASGTAGTITVSGSNTSQLSTQAAKTVTPTTSEQTAVAAGKYTTGAIKVAAMPSGTAGTPDIQLGVISNHTATLYPWVQNTTGYITGGTKTGSAYTISASQLTSGTKSITANGTGIDVTNYSSVNVNVPIPEAPTKKRINFVDYDGTILYSYWQSEWWDVTSLPSNPSHEGLTAQGWNWTKAQIDETQGYSESEVWVGQMYTTEYQSTKIHIDLWDGREHPYLGIGVNGIAEINWGDNTEWETVTGSSTSTVTYIDHQYDTGGEYTIEISVSSGNVVLCGDQYISNTLKKDTTSTTVNKHRVYANAIKRVEIGANTSLGDYAFCNCTSLESVTIPSGTSVGAGAFNGCCSLKGLTIPSGVTSVRNHLCAGCTSLRTVSLPSSITQVGVYAFDGCGSLEGVGLPYSVTSIGANAFANCKSITYFSTPAGLTSLGATAFANCHSLRELYFVDEVETIPNSAFLNCCSVTEIWLSWSTTTIEESAFSGCLSIASVYVPDALETIGNYAFADCYGVAMYHFFSETPPTLGTNVFQNIQPDCKIYVPSASVSAYKTATNWSAYASYIEADPDE